MTDDRELAARHFREEQEPELRRSGMPDEGVEYLRQRYIENAPANPEAVRQLRLMYPDPDRANES